MLRVQYREDCLSNQHKVRIRAILFLAPIGCSTFYQIFIIFYIQQLNIIGNQPPLPNLYSLLVKPRPIASRPYNQRVQGILPELGIKQNIIILLVYKYNQMSQYKSTHTHSSSIKTTSETLFKQPSTLNHDNASEMVGEHTQEKAIAFQPGGGKEKDEDIVNSLIKDELDNSFNAQSSGVKGKIGKSKSLMTLGSKGVKLGFSPEEIMEKRFKQSKKEVQSQIAELEKNCHKFGGHEYIRNQMNKQQITPEQLYQFYWQRITSIHGSLTLPKLPTRHPKNSQPPQKSPPRSPLNPIQKYNKWYINPTKRFTSDEPVKESDIKRVTKYIEKILNEKRDKVTICQDYAPILVKQSALRLGRFPVICSYAEIKRR